jgi:hypothetical protein
MDIQPSLSVPSPRRHESSEDLLQESILTTTSRSINDYTLDDAGHTHNSTPFFRPKYTGGRPIPKWLTTSALWFKDMTIFKSLLILFYLNIVAWGGMIFLLLCNAAPAMCHPSCNHVNSPRRKWIEIDSQILNALFCVPAFGLAPQRFRDVWRLLQVTFGGRKRLGPLQRLAARRRGWFRLPGSQNLPHYIGPAGVEEWLLTSPAMLAAVPHPVQCIPEAPLSGKRAKPTEFWKLATAVWLEIMNTAFQAVLSGFMWGYNRHTRPAWSVPLFLCLAFMTSITAGVLGFLEGRNVKRVEDDVSLINPVVKGA